MNGKISNLMQVASVRRYTVTDGAMQGLRIIDCDNGKLRFLLNESKTLDMMQLYHKGQNISFISKNGFSVRNDSFLGRFEGGMVYTCGLDSLGARDGFEMHGSLHNRVASVTKAECTAENIVIEAEIKDSALFGKNLVLKRKVYTAIGSDSVTISDTLVNEGYRKEEFCLLYHVNAGYPLLDEGCKITADTKEIVPRTEWAKERLGLRGVINAPVPEEEETCYFIEMNRPAVTLSNEKLGKKFTLSYSGDTLPHFIQWKSMASGDYALGLEPCTSLLDENFRYTEIRPQEEIQFCLNLKVED